MKNIQTIPQPKFEVTCRDYRRGHLYTANGNEYPSVTGVLNIVGGGKTNALIIWARREALKLAEREIISELEKGNQLTSYSLNEILARADRQPDKIKDAAADLGTRIHAAIDAYIAGNVPELDAETTPGFQNFLTWLKGAGLDIVMGDTAVVSEQHGYGGRLDSVAVDRDGKYVLLDWKTSNKLREEYPLQVAAYAQAFYETYGVKIERAIVVRFGKDEPGDFEAAQVVLVNAWDGFVSALGLQQAMKGKLWEATA
jgi:hypothetical protein